EIICPNCNKAFQVDEASFAQILKQVRDHQFEEELQSRLELLEKEKASAIQLTEAALKNKFQEILAQKDKELIELKAKKEQELAELLAKKEAELIATQSKLANAETEKQLSINQAIKALEDEKNKLIH